MPDDISGEQIHIIYAVPRGGIDRGLDITSRFPNSIGSVNNWLRQQTNGTLEMKLDTYQGRLDITFVSLPRTDAEYEAYGDQKVLPVQADLRSMGQIRSNKIYMVYYEGGWTVSCGQAGHLEHGNQTGIIYLKGLENRAGVNPCDNNPIAQSPNDHPTYLDFMFLHEILHTNNVYHVYDSPFDLMYGGATDWSRPTSITLDVGKNDYAFSRAAGNFPANKTNIYESPYMRRIGR